MGDGEDQWDPWISWCLVFRWGADGPELQLQLHLQPGEVLQHGYQWEWEQGMGWRGEGGWDLNRTHIGMAILVMGIPLPHPQNTPRRG